MLAYIIEILFYLSLLAGFLQKYSTLLSQVSSYQNATSKVFKSEFSARKNAEENASQRNFADAYSLLSSRLPAPIWRKLQPDIQKKLERLSLTTKLGKNSFEAFDKNYLLRPRQSYSGYFTYPWPNWSVQLELE